LILSPDPRTKKFFYRARLVFWCALIFYFSSVPYLKTDLGVWDTILRKIAHAAVYGLLFVFARSAFADSSVNIAGATVRPRRFELVWPVLFSIIYAVSDEYHQTFVPGRSGSAADVLIDTSGVALAVWLEIKGHTARINRFFREMKPNRAIFLFLPILLAAVLAVKLLFFGASHDFMRAAKLAEAGRYVDAAVRYERFADRRPSHRLASSAIFEAAGIYNFQLRLPAKAASLYRRAEADYSSDPALLVRARAGLLRSPDYFPLIDGAQWVEGDSATGGANMKAIWSAHEVSTGVFRVDKKFFAGPMVVTTRSVYYAVSGYALLESQSRPDSGSAVFLEHPIYHGKKWSRRDGARVAGITVEFVPTAVKVRAGVFGECIRIGEKYTDSPGVIRYSYYAPYVGWVLTTISGSRGEHRNSELITFKLRG
jgi:VanZ family protein